MAPGEPSKYVTLVSGDGFEFVVFREATKVSPIISGMIDPRSGFAEAKDARCVFQEIRSVSTKTLGQHHIPSPRAPHR
jgi:elongin-C